MITKAELDTFEQFKNEYMCEFFWYCFRIGETYEYERFPGTWVPCLLLEDRPDRPYEFFASYLNHCGNWVRGIVRKNELRVPRGTVENKV